MKKKIAIALIILAVIVAAIAVWWVMRDIKPVEPQQPEPTPVAEEQLPVQSGQVAITIADFKYQPDKIVIKKGSVVTWTNQDDDEHNVNSDSDSAKRGLNGPLLGKGQTFQHTFNEVGTYTYHCRPHPYMTGSVRVVE